MMEANEGTQHHWRGKSYRLAVTAQELMKTIKTLRSLMSLYTPKSWKTILSNSLIRHHGMPLDLPIWKF